ncbi:MAG: cyclase [Acidobacteriota bacterium]
MSVFAFVEHSVKDFDSWKVVFEENQVLRESHGAIRHWLYRSAENSNEVFIATEFPTLEQAKGFAADPALPAAMERAGVEGPPRISFRVEDEVVDY